MTFPETPLPYGPVRRDKRGRRIGHNWWREMNHDLWFWATAAWEREQEATALGYATEMAEFREANPPPTFKSFLLANAGQFTRGEHP